MKAAFFPVGDINRASSRYRAHNIVAARKEFVLGRKDNWKGADALVFQRTFGGRHYDFAKQARVSGKLVVVDISDFYFYRHKWKPGNVKPMVNLAHCLTTSNADDQYLMKELYKKSVYIIPNAQKMSKHQRKHQNVPVPTVVWLGRENTMLKTLGSIWPVFTQLSFERVQFRVLIVNDNGNLHGLQLPFNQVVGRRWKLGEVHKTVSGCDVGVCPQVKQANGRYHKDVNKAVTCWTCGVPCVTFGLTKNWHDDLRKCLTDWRFRQQQGKRGIARAKEWSPDYAARIWMKVISKELGKLK